MAKQKIEKTFRDVPPNSWFYTAQYPDKQGYSPSLKFFKEENEESNAWNLEFGHQEIHLDQPCWWYLED